MQYMKHIAIQGIQGSYHQQAAQLLYGSVRVHACGSFDELTAAVKTGQVDCGVMAIGNSIAGSILPNYSLIHNNNLWISAEVYLPVHHHLIALAGQSLEDIYEVQSHPMALLQCKSYFKKFPHIKLVETDDTAAAAMRIQQEGKIGVAAIASKQAAKLYGLAVLSDSIQENIDNLTRFIVVHKECVKIARTDKATLVFTTRHEAGGLAKVLTLFAVNHMNLTKILSIPIVTEPFMFSFLVEVCYPSKKIFEEVVDGLRELTGSLSILGMYKTYDS